MSSKWEQFRVVLALALAVARIQDGCSGYACFRPWLLPAILRSTWLLATLGSVVAGTRDSCSGYACFRPCLLSMGPPRPANTKTRVDRSPISTRDFALYLGFGRAGRCESGIAAPATLVSGLGCLPRSRRARETQKRA